jgi:hypothetical protein
VAWRSIGTSRGSVKPASAESNEAAEKFVHRKQWTEFRVDRVWNPRNTLLQDRPVPHPHELSRSGQNWTDWREIVLPHCSHDNQDDSRIPCGRGPKSYRQSATNGTRSCAHPAAAAWPPSHGKTAQDWNCCPQSKPQPGRRKKEKNRRGSSQETTRRGKGGSENPQEGVIRM